MKKILITLALFAVNTAAFSQECFQILQPTLIFKQSDGNYTLSIKYNTTGLKALSVVVKLDNEISFDSCFLNNGNGTKNYTDLVCRSGNIYAILTPKTGSCSSTPCPRLPIIYGPGAGPQPVKLSGFSAIRTKKLIALEWTTEFEIDAKEFIVERAEGNEFRSVGIIPLNGNSSTKKSYSFNDKNENIGNTYYRLKNVDLDGKFTYSQIRTVKGYGTTDDVTVFPNPARSNSKISVVGVTANSSIQLLDFSGKVLKNINSSIVNLIDLSGVKNGSYLIRIIDKLTNEVVNKKLTVHN